MSRRVLEHCAKQVKYKLQLAALDRFGPFSKGELTDALKTLYLVDDATAQAIGERMRDKGFIALFNDACTQVPVFTTALSMRDEEAKMLASLIANKLGRKSITRRSYVM